MTKTVRWLILLMWVPQVWGAPEVRTVLLFPFENRSPRADLSWISESFTEVLSSRLTSPYCYVLGREERNASYEVLDIPPAPALTLASTYKVAELLGVDSAVIGSFDLAGERLSARAQLLDMRRLKLSAPLEVAGELAELGDLQTHLAWRLRATLDPGFTVGTEEDFRRRFPVIRLDALENYIRGILATDAESRLPFLREAHRLNPDDHRAALELGRYHFDQKEYAESAQWLRKLDARDPDHLEALFLLGVDEFFLGHEAAAEKALASLAQRISLNEVANNLGVIKTRRSLFADALPHFERAFQGDPSDPDFCFNLGVCLGSLHNYPEAAKVLEQCLRLNEEDVEAHAMLALVLAQLGDAAGHQREVQWLTDREGNSAENLNGDLLPQTRLKKKYDGRAARLLELAVRNALEERLAGEPPERHGDVHLARGKKLLAQGLWPEAERELTEAASLLPRDSEAHLALAQVYAAQGRNRAAAAELEVSLKLKNTAIAHLWLARVYLSLDQPEAAGRHGEAALSLDPNNHEAQALIDQIPKLAPAAGKKH